MRTSVTHPGGVLELELDADRIVGAWNGPTGMTGTALPESLRRSLEAPLDFPPLTSSVVPGDRVVIAADPAVPDLESVLAVVVNLMETAGVDRDSITVLETPGASASASRPAGVGGSRHDPEDRAEIAYLASTNAGRRVYLNRRLTDADFVLPIGAIVKDPLHGWVGPWSTLFPGLSDEPTRRESLGDSARGGGTGPYSESSEVGWLLGNQFQIGVIPGAEGVAAVAVGLGSSVREAGVRDSEAAWTFRVDRRADLVIVGVGAGAGLEATWSALATGAGLVRRGGRVVALSDAPGPIGPAARRLAGAEGYGSALAALEGAESEPDYPAARRLAEALAWADLYLLSALDPDEVEEIGLMPLGSASEAARLASRASDVTLVGHAEWTAASVVEDQS